MASAQFGNILTTSVPPGFPIPLVQIIADGADITFTSPTDIILQPGRYLVNYSVSAWNMVPFNGNANCKIMFFLNNVFIVTSFSGGPVADGASMAAGNFLVVVPAGPALTLQMRNDIFGGILTEFTDVSVVVSTVT